MNINHENLIINHQLVICVYMPIMFVPILKFYQIATNMQYYFSIYFKSVGQQKSCHRY